MSYKIWKTIKIKRIRVPDIFTAGAQVVVPARILQEGEQFPDAVGMQVVHLVIFTGEENFLAR